MKTMLLISGLVVLRGQWQIWPNIGTFLLFAVGFVLLQVLLLPPRREAGPLVKGWRLICAVIATFSFVAGLVSNWTVIIANGGFMPGTSVSEPFSVWVRGEGHHLLFLGDNYGGWSIGDFMLLTSIPIMLIGKIGQHKRSRDAATVL